MKTLNLNKHTISEGTQYENDMGNKNLQKKLYKKLNISNIKYLSIWSTNFETLSVTVILSK